jgi:hypothetical protein
MAKSHFFREPNQLTGIVPDILDIIDLAFRILVFGAHIVV